MITTTARTINIDNLINYLRIEIYHSTNKADLTVWTNGRRIYAMTPENGAVLAQQDPQRGAFVFVT
jgi:hypothetical protein